MLKISWLVVVVAVVVLVADAGDGRQHSSFNMVGSSWHQDSSKSFHLPNMTSENLPNNTNNYVNNSDNHVTSLWYHDNFYSLTDKNGTIHKLLNKSIGTGILDKALDYLFNKLGTSYGGGQDDAHLGHHRLTPTWHQKSEEVEDDGYYGRSYRSYQDGNSYLSMRNTRVCKNSLGIVLGNCLNIQTTFAIAALAILLQLAMSYTVSSLCSDDGDNDIPAVRNKNYINITISEGSQTQNQDQEQEQDQYQYQDQSQYQYQEQSQEQSQEQYQEQSQDQEQYQSQYQYQSAPRALDGRNSRRRRSDQLEDGGEIFDYEDLYDDLDHDLFPIKKKPTGPSRDRLSLSSQSKDKDQQEGQSHRGFDLLTPLTEWLMWPTWQTMFRNFRESRLLLNSNYCSGLRSFVSG
ncbi:myb-like protein P [Homarus americanus]|uniref:myb-like protein P n=1 Tax=Homarus americanus TaxID=6706 RepID=UPI001C45BE0B|nr:myb-like protein P [Homarus americanus]